MYNNKGILLLLILIPLLVVTNTLAQDVDFEQISKIIKSGNAKDLVQQFSTTVELNLDGEEASYSKAQAEAVLKDFFNKFPPEAFKVNHQGSSKSGLPYAIGEYKNSSGSYRVWIRMKEVDGKNLVNEMSFIKD